MTHPAASLMAAAERLQPEVVALRRRLHSEPELGLVLPRTQEVVLEALASLDLDLDVATGGETSSVVATLTGARPGPTLLLRGDMDALPLQEETGLEFASRQPGRMHACGHDAHTAMLFGAVRLLAERREQLAGTVKFLFQTGEEGYGGARILVEEGLLERAPKIESAFAIHVDPTLPCGLVATRPGPILAAMDIFSVELAGKAGHASMPHQTRDPIPAACEIVTALQAMVTRRIDVFDPGVLSVTCIEAGTAHNLIPERAKLVGTTRAFSERSRKALHEGLERIVVGVCAAHELLSEIEIRAGYPVTVNDAGVVEQVRGAAWEFLDEKRFLEMPAPIMGSEDFSYILQQVPGALAFLGARPREGPIAPIHSNHMRLDEDAMMTGVALHTAVALATLRGAP